MEASPICRGKNLTLETVMAFVNAMPKERLQKKEFHAIAESKLKGWTQTHSQIARQLALYYEDEGYCFPRFCGQTTNAIVFEYIKHWASLYYVPNLYTPSLIGYPPTNIYAYLRTKINDGESSFSKACTELFGISLNNTDKVRVFLNNFTDIVIEDDKLSRNTGIIESTIPVINPNITDINDAKLFYNYFGNTIISTPMSHSKSFSALQQIFYGAPGTGKSHRIKEIIKEHNIDEKEQVIRTTFHPDSDYSTFVGCYKPIMKSVPQTYVVEGNEKPVMADKDNQATKEEIVYDYTPQAFVQAYTKAWTTNMPVILVIEEINRGNCAQIFGDIFQLLDRGDDGVSEYEIKPDKALENYLKEYFATFDDLDEQIKSGKIMKLPSNLYIWATMNTSDQSLFPIDSAFKRRWEWKYMKIVRPYKKNEDGSFKLNENGEKIPFGFKIEGDHDWWEFLEQINAIIDKMTNSADKQLGYFFAKAKDDIISYDTFVSKVCFYLWNDIFKTYALDEQQGDLFKFAKKIKDKDENEKEVIGHLSFPEFYDGDGNVVPDVARQFIEHVMAWNTEGKKENS